MADFLNQLLHKILKDVEGARRVFVFGPPGFDQEIIQKRLLALKNDLEFSQAVRANLDFKTPICFSNYLFDNFDPLDEAQPRVVFLKNWNRENLTELNQNSYGDFSITLIDEILYYSKGIPWVLRTFFKEISGNEIPGGEELHKKFDEIFKKYFLFLKAHDIESWPLFVRLMHCRIEGEFEKALLEKAGLGFTQYQFKWVREKYFELFKEEFKSFEVHSFPAILATSLGPIEQLEAFRLGFGAKPNGDIVESGLQQASKLRDPYLVNWICENFFKDSAEAFHVFSKARSHEFLGFPEKAIEILKDFVKCAGSGEEGQRARLEIIRMEYYRLSPRRFLNLVESEIKKIPKKSFVYPLFRLELHRGHRGFDPKLAEKILNEEIQNIGRPAKGKIKTIELEIQGRAAFFEGFLLFHQGKLVEANENFVRSSKIFRATEDWRSFFESELNLHAALNENFGRKVFKEKFFEIRPQLEKLNTTLYARHLEDSKLNIAAFEGDSLEFKLVLRQNQNRMLQKGSELEDPFNLPLVEKFAFWLIEFGLFEDAKIYLDLLLSKPSSESSRLSGLKATTELLGNFVKISSAKTDVDRLVEEKGFKKILKSNALVKTAFLHLGLVSGSGAKIWQWAESFIGDALTKVNPRISDAEHLIVIGSHALLNSQINLAESLFKRGLELAQKWGNGFHQVKALILQALVALVESRFSKCQEIITELEGIDKQKMHNTVEIDLGRILPVLLCIKKDQFDLARQKLLALQSLPDSVQIVNRVFKSKQLESIHQNSKGTIFDKFYDSLFNILFTDLSHQIKVLSPQGSKRFYQHEAPKFEPAKTSFIYDETKKEVWVFGVPVADNLTSLQQKILLYFLENQSLELSKENITQKIWQEEYNPAIHDSRVYTAINRLKRMLLGEFRQKSKHKVPEHYRKHVNRFFSVTRNGYVLDLPGDWVWIKEVGDHKDLSPGQKWILSYLDQNKVISRLIVQKTLKIGMTSAKLELKSLVKARKIRKIGGSKATLYTKFQSN